MLWGVFFFSSRCSGNLGRIHGIMGRYEKIQNQNLAVSIKKMKLGHDWRFQCANDLKHIQNHTKTVWISQTPDLNPSEYLWSVQKLGPLILKDLA